MMLGLLSLSENGTFAYFSRSSRALDGRKLFVSRTRIKASYLL